MEKTLSWLICVSRNLEVSYSKNKKEFLIFFVFFLLFPSPRIFSNKTEDRKGLKTEDVRKALEHIARNPHLQQVEFMHLSKNYFDSTLVERYL